MRRDTFATVHTEGAILPVDLLQRIAAGDRELDGLKPEDYHLAPGERLNEATNRAWTRLTAVWSGFRAATSAVADGDAATGTTRDRWLLPLFQELGYGRLPATRGAREIEGRQYAISHFYQQAPLHLVGFGVKLDERTAGVAGAARTSPHGLLQEFLNRSDANLWGIVANGLRLRVLRDNVSLTRQAYVEFDLEAMMEGEVYSDFVLLWLVCHQSRLEGDNPAECWLEKWSQTAQDQGARALDKLRRGVEEAIAALGTGFLSHPANGALRERLQSGKLDVQGYYRQLLRLVYRFIFLFVAESRDLLCDPVASASARERYTRFYAMARLRRLAEGLRGTRHTDLYHGLRLVMERLDVGGCPELGLPALGGHLFSAGETADLSGAQIANSDLLSAVRALAFLPEGSRRRPVDYRNLRSEELGSVYESLLEMHPDLNVGAATFVLDSAAGNERKTSGSYYTPDSLVQCLLDSALDPVLNEAAAGRTRADAAKAVLALKVCDPASGSGHFLIGAAHRIAKRLAAIRTGDEEPSPEATRSALRDVIGRCLYGVDVNPMAVELCKVALWMEALEPGKPLSFMDHHVLCGNSLLGATPDSVVSGLPDEAFVPMEGDDPKACSALRRRNKAEREGLGPLFAEEDAEIQARLVQAAAKLEELPDDRPEDVRTKELAFRRREGDQEYRHKKLVADAWCAAFVVRKRLKVPGRDTSASGITQGLINGLASGQVLPDGVDEEVERLRVQYRFFHWHLAFPEVFARGGFDCVVGNPPWERVKLQEQEFFASRSEMIAGAQNAAARKRLIAGLPVTDPALWEEWCAATREAQGESRFARSSGRYPLCGKGDVNTYSLFAEHNWQILSPRGRAGFIVPSGIATDDTTKDYFQAITKSGALRSMWEFENEGFFSAGKGHMLRFALTTLSGKREPAAGADFMFQGQAVSDLKDPERHFTLSATDIETINPNTGTCPIFRTKRDASIALAIYRRTGVLWREGDPNGNPWGLRFMAMFHMANDSGLFRTRAELVAAGWELEGNRFVRRGIAMLPLYEAKMAHIYNHRSGTFEGAASGERAHILPTPSDRQLADPRFLPLPFYWIAEGEVAAKTDGVWDRGWMLGWRDVTDARASVRTVVACAIPRSGVNDKFLLMLPSAEPRLAAMLYANLCCFALDYCARQKVGGISLKYFTMRQLPALAPSTYSAPALWDREKRLRDWFLPRVLELTYTAYDMQSFAEDCGDGGAPFIWDPDRRFHLQCEIDAAFFHLYGVSRDDVDYMLDTFPVVMRSDLRAYREFRTKRVILEMYDALARAANTGGPFVSPLPPPRRAH